MSASDKMDTYKDGTGGTLYWLLGYVLVGLSAWLFFDSTRMTTMSMGWVTGWMPRGGFWNTTSMAVVFVPLLGGLFWLIYTWIAGGDSKWAKALSWSGLAVVAVEVLSRVRFHMMMKTSYFLVLLAMLACGLAMLLRARVLDRREASK